MTKRHGAKPYSTALLSVCLSEGDPERAARELAGFAELAAEHPSLASTMSNPAVASDAKRAIVVELCERMGFQPVVRNLLAHLGSEGSFGLLRSLVTDYQARLREHQQTVDAEVTTAVPLTGDRAQALLRSLSEATGKKVTMTTTVDPAILGGVVARVGSVIYDGSVARQLERIREDLYRQA
ncbi:MAG: ATP synthase F1 subunit delta [Vicinamibacterales bacterium]